MNINSLLDQFLGSKDTSKNEKSPQDWTGFAGGAAAGGILGLLMGGKSARKFMGNAATYGGMALLGGLAYRAFQNWQQNKSLSQAQLATSEDVTLTRQEFLPSTQNSNQPLQLTVVKAMIAASKSDGHLDANEQKKIFAYILSTKLSDNEKSLLLENIDQEIPLQELANSVSTLEHKSEVYLASCLATSSDNRQSKEYLLKLSTALGLPKGLAEHLEKQAFESELSAG